MKLEQANPGPNRSGRTQTDRIETVLRPQELFAGFEPEGIVTVAVSGGGDSVALLALAHGWAQTRDITLHAVTVDHGLRPEAAAEAAFVASLCEGMGIDHTTLGWEGIKPFSGIAEAARRARYDLIGEFAAAIGSDLILLGHTADDQAETVYMRLARERQAQQEQTSSKEDGNAVSLGRGMAGMARLTLLAGDVYLGRPLLGVTRQSLRRYLASIPQGWVEDPTNEDTSFERVRVRQKIAATQGPGEDGLRDSLTGFAEIMGRYRAVLARDAALLLERAVTVQPGPVFLFDAEKASRAAEPVRLLALQVLIALAGGGEHLTARGRIAPLLDWPDRVETAKTTIGGAVVEKVAEKTGTAYRFYREMRNLESLDVEPGESLVWDGRLEIINNGRDVIHVGPLSHAGLEKLEGERALKIAVRPRAALISTSVIRRGNQILLPLVETGRKGAGETGTGNGSGAIETRMTARAIEHFCPQTDFAVLAWLRALELERRACLLPRP